MLFQKKLKLTYIANMGITVESGKKKVLVDAVHTKADPPFICVPDDILEALTLNKAPYNNIDLMLFTHAHKDHFDPSAVYEVIKRNKLINVVGTSEAILQIKTLPGYMTELDSQLHSINIAKDKTIEYKLKDISFEVTNICHDGSDDRIDDLVYLFEMNGKTIMHLGDARAEQANFENSTLLDRQVDVLIVPYSFIGLSEGRKVIRRIKPKMVIVSHLPSDDRDTTGLFDKVKKIYEKKKNSLPPCTILNTPGQTILI